MNVARARKFLIYRLSKLAGEYLKKIVKCIFSNTEISH